MTASTTLPLQKFLRKADETITALEIKALEALHEAHDESLYRALMEEKARFLAALATEAAPLLQAMGNTPAACSLAETLHSFSTNAATALRLQSVFYMSALLYPDDHKAGEPNNLQLLIDSLQE